MVTELNIDIEYPLHVSAKLKVSIDYFLHFQTQLLVIQAKNGDMDKGFTQLAVELIAMNEYLQEAQVDIIYGAVTMGDMWRFGVLYRADKLIVKNIEAFTVPTDLEALFAVLLGILDKEA